MLSPEAEVNTNSSVKGPRKNTSPKSTSIEPKFSPSNPSSTNRLLNQLSRESSMTNELRTDPSQAPINVSHLTETVRFDLEFGTDESSDGLDENDSNLVTYYVSKARSRLCQIFEDHGTCLKGIGLGLLFLLYNAYLARALTFSIETQAGFDCCNGVGFLSILTLLGYWCLLYYCLIVPFFGEWIQSKIFSPIQETMRPIWKKWHLGKLVALLIILAISSFLFFDSRAQPKRMVSSLGVLVVIAFGLLISKHPGKIQWSQIFKAIGLQFTFGLLILRWETGQRILNCLSDKVGRFLRFSDVGSSFIYGYLSSGREDLSLPSIFAFRALPVIFFFSFVIQMLYHYGIMQRVVAKIGWLLQITIGTTAAESMNAAANIFIGLSEAPILIKPFLYKMTNSEIHALMTCGFATIAGTVMAAYISFGISASYLLSASIMASAGALGYSKLVYPETRVSQTTAKGIESTKLQHEGNVLNAATQGAIQGVMLIGVIIANIIGFTSFVAFLNAVFSWFGGLIGMEYISFEFVLGKVFIPLAWVIGVDYEEVEDVAILIGLKSVTNEFIAYQRLATMVLSPRSKAIATYALCSFANFGSIGIQLGALSTLSPERRVDIAKTIFRAFIAGTAVGFLNASIAGAVLSVPGYAEWKAMENLGNVTSAIIS